MWKKSFWYFLLGIGASFNIGLVNMFLLNPDCFDGHDVFCMGHLIAPWTISWRLFPWPVIFYGFPGGIIAGFIGTFLHSRFAKKPLHKVGFVLLTIILSCFLSNLFIGWFWKL